MNQEEKRGVKIMLGVAVASALLFKFSMDFGPVIKEMTTPVSSAEADTMVIEDPELNLPDETALWRKKELVCLAQNIYHEARSESTIGRVAVAYVTLNRVSAGFAQDICGVVKSAKIGPDGLPMKDRCAFSWYCDGVSDKIGDTQTYETILELSEDIIEGRRFTDDPTEGSTYYHNTSVYPRWAARFTRTVRIDGHIFYREEPK